MSEFSEIYEYTPRPINPDEGVSMMIVEGGRKIVTYMSMPGLYLNASGEEVSDEEARAVGFDLEKDRKEAVLRKKIRDATEGIRREEAQIEADIRAELDGQKTVTTPFKTPDAAIGQKVHDQILAVSPEDQDLIIARNSNGFPRETEDFYMDHHGAGLWSIYDRATKERLHSKLNVLEAIRTLVTEQKEKNAL